MTNGSPVTKGTVAFFAVDPAKGAETFGLIDAQGAYSARVFPGKYRIAIEPEWVRAATPPRSSAIPKKYWTAENSELEVVISSSGSDALDFQLK